MSEPSDAVLASAAQGGDHRAAGILAERYAVELRRRIGSRYFISGADADDVAAECLFGLAEAIRDFRPGRGSTFRSFAHLCATRRVHSAMTAQSRHKAQAHHRSRSLSEPVGTDGDDGAITLGDTVTDISLMGRDPADVVNQVNPLRLIESAAHELSKTEMTAIVAVAAGESYEEISRRLRPRGRKKASRKSVDNAIQRARRKLGRYLDAA